MKRNLKNIVMILIIIAVGVCSYFTMKNTQTTNNNGGANQQNSQTIPQMLSQDSNSSENLNSNGDMGEPPAKPDEENNSNSSNNQNSRSQMGEPPAKPDEENNSNSSNNQNSGNQMGEPPTKPDGENSSSSTNMQGLKEMPNMNQQNSNGGIKTIHYVMFGIEGLVISLMIIYLAMSRFNKYTLKEILNEVNTTIIFILLVIIVTVILTVAQVCITKKLLDSNSSITLTGDSYITSLDDSDSSYSNINFNGYKLYVNGVSIN